MVDALVFDQPSQQLAGLAAVVLAKKPSNGLQRNVALKIQLQVLEQITDELNYLEL